MKHSLWILNVLFWVRVLGNLGYVFLLAVASLFVGSGLAGPMSSSYGSYYTPTTTTYAPKLVYYSPPVYTTQAPYTTTTYAAPTYYATEAPK